MDPKQRYCMKCGAINFEHPENSSMKQYISEEEIEKSKKEYDQAVGNIMEIEIGGQVYQSKALDKTGYIDSRTGLVPVIILTIVFGSLCYFLFHFALTVSLIIALVYFVFSFSIITTACIYMKGGYSGFTPFIPFYGQYAFFDMAVGKGWYFLFSLIPIFGVFYLLYGCYKLGKAFNKSGWLTLFFPFIMFPVIAFSDSAVYEGKGEKYSKFIVSGKRRNVMVPALVYSIILFLTVFVPIKYVLEPRIQKMSFTSNAASLLHSVQKDVEYGNYMCEGKGAGRIPGRYYVTFDDASTLSSIGTMTSSFNGNKMKGYIMIVVDENLNSSFYITMTDGEQGIIDFPAEKRNEVERTIQPIKDIYLPEDAIFCEKS